MGCMRCGTPWVAALALVIGASHSIDAGAAAVSFQVGFDDPGMLYASYYGGIRSNVLAAGSEWATYLAAPSDVVLQVQVSFAAIASATGASFTNAFIGKHNGLATYEQGAAYEVATGIDPNGAAPDIHITIGTQGYLQNQLWFDPSPYSQTAAVPIGQTDARSVFLHEIAHALVFNGWRDGQTGQLPGGGYESTFDALVATGSFNGQPQLYFTGSEASSIYGGPVPLAFGDYAHVGNAPPRPGATLVPDLMNGLDFVDGSRYHVSALDVAILHDAAALAVPEPSSAALTLGGLFGLALWRRRAQRPA